MEGTQFTEFHRIDCIFFLIPKNFLDSLTVQFSTYVLKSFNNTVGNRNPNQPRTHCHFFHLDLLSFNRIPDTDVLV